MNVPNQLTVSRLVLTLIFIVAVLWQFPMNDTLALVLFSIAGFTDYLDGKIARSRNLITNFGILMDPLVDKIMTCSAFIALVDLGRVQAWMVIIIVARELAITGLRLLAASKNLVLAAERYGKHKTISQIVAIHAVLILDASREWGQWTELGIRSWLPRFAEISLWVTVALTFTSGALYLWRNRRFYLDDM